MWKVLGLLMCLAVFPACHKKSPSSKQEATQAADDAMVDTLAADNWQFQVFGAGWVSVPVDDAIQVSMENQRLSMLLFFMKDPTQDEFQSYVVKTLGGLLQMGVKVDDIHSATMDGNQATQITTISPSGKHVWIWITVKNANAYLFTCASGFNADAGTTRFELCQKMANTIQIK